MLPALLALCSAAISQAPQASPIEQELAPDAVRFAPGASTATPSLVERRARVRNFLAQRATPGGTRAQSTALEEAVAEHAALVSAASGRPRAHLQGTSSLSAPWTPLGPTALLSPLYGAVTGRVTALAPDPNDPTGNTLYIGTTGGGVWKSTNAAGPLASVSFVPLTDTLPVFSANAGYSTLPSLSIGALAVQSAPNPVLLAGTGDPNDATDSLYGEGILRSADGGLTWTVVAGSHDGANGNHSFAGLATAALAWSTRSPGLAVAAFFQLARRPDRWREWRLLGAGLVCLNRRRNDLEHGFRLRRCAGGATTDRRHQCRHLRHVRSVECAARPLLCSSSRAWLLQLRGWCELDASHRAARHKPHDRQLSGAFCFNALHPFSRNPRGAARNGRHVRLERGCERQRPGALAGPVQCGTERKLQQQRSALGHTPRQRRP